MKSNITGGETEFLYRHKILNKYNIDYFRCKDTGFIQTEKPYWLDEAYSNPIATLDVGLLQRCLQMRTSVSKVFSSLFNGNACFLDYAGGYGTLTRLMRDINFNYFHYDQYCDNIFAAHFSVNPFENKEKKYDAVTAIEFIEHTENPTSEISKLLEITDFLFLATSLVPTNLKDTRDWPYMAFETGQHISFFTVKSFQSIADQLGVYFYTDNCEHHFFSRTKLEKNPAELLKYPFIIRKFRNIVRRHEQGHKSGTNIFEADVNLIKSMI